GDCLVLLDGLDEVSKDVRPKIQCAIKDFVGNHRFASKETRSFNRFLITSRVADYDQNAFPNADYLHYTIARLLSGQMERLLQDCCYALVSYHPAFRNQKEDVKSEEAGR